MRVRGKAGPEDGTTDQATAQCTIDYLFANLPRDDVNQLANAETIDEASEEQISTLTDGLIECSLGSSE